MSEKFKIYVDEDGNEVRREPLRRGRRPKGATVDEEGNLILTPEVAARKALETVFYIDLDASGKEISRRPKGRGRPSPGYTKQESGALVGHWVKAVATPTPVETNEVEATTVVAPVEETVTTE